MRTTKLVLMLLVAFNVAIFAQKKDVIIEKSNVTWTGKKIGGSHTGEIKIKSGNFELSNGVIASGKVIMNMNSITCTDLKDKGYNDKLIGHLKSDDFFGVEKYPTATFELIKGTKFINGKATVSGKITIKGKTEIITYDIIKSGEFYTAQLKVDRSKFDVRYGSNSFFDNLGDKAIDNIFILDIKIAL